MLPFNRFPDADTLLGPEMRSTGEVMGIDRTFGLAFAKSQIAAGDRLPDGGTVFLSLADRDKPAGVQAAARRFVELGFAIVATAGTADAPRGRRRPGRASVVAKLGRGRRGRRPTRSTSSPRARSTSWSTAPGAGAPGPTAPTSARPPTCTGSRASPPAAAGPGRRRAAWPTGPATRLRVRLACRSYHAGRLTSCRTVAPPPSTST